VIFTFFVGWVEINNILNPEINRYFFLYCKQIWYRTSRCTGQHTNTCYNNAPPFTIPGPTPHILLSFETSWTGAIPREQYLNTIFWYRSCGTCILEAWIFYATKYLFSIHSRNIFRTENENENGIILKWGLQNIPFLLLLRHILGKKK